MRRITITIWFWYALIIAGLAYHHLIEPLEITNLTVSVIIAIGVIDILRHLRNLTSEPEESEEESEGIKAKENLN